MVAALKQTTTVKEAISTPRRVALGADHEGDQLKDKLVAELREERHSAKDHGLHGGGLGEAADIADIVTVVAQAVLSGEADLAVVVCGSGAAASIAANKIRGIRAAHCANVVSARQARSIADANMLCLGARVVGPELASEIVRTWVVNEFSGEERHRRLLLKVEEMEEVFGARRHEQQRPAALSAGHADG